MKVMVTGGTGFVGSNSVAALVRQGHSVRLLVRSLEKVKPALEPLGIDDIEAMAGDVLDRSSIERAAEGCEATLHCGSVYSLDPRMSATITHTNVAGTENVLSVASSRGHDPIIHVSSYVALIGEKGGIISPQCSPTYPPGTYFESKAESDRVARMYQNRNIPVVITYPGSVWGPHDPHCGESCQMALSILKNYWRFSVDGTLLISDVRDIADLHAALMEKGRGPRRYLAPTQNTSICNLFSLFSDITGRKIKTTALPGWSMRAAMQAVDLVQQALKMRLPFNYQAVYCSTLQHVGDDSATRKDFGIAARPLRDTLGDQVDWMVEKGLLEPQLAGKTL